MRHRGVDRHHEVEAGHDGGGIGEGAGVEAASQVGQREARAERRDLLEVLEVRYERAATVITSQLSSKTWHAALGDPTIADAICDRLVHNAHEIAPPVDRSAPGSYCGPADTAVTTTLSSRFDL